jgi:hypothetical protein
VAFAILFSDFTQQRKSHHKTVREFADAAGDKALALRRFVVGLHALRRFVVGLHALSKFVVGLHALPQFVIGLHALRRFV